jgi:hypothetical protein
MGWEWGRWRVYFLGITTGNTAGSPIRRLQHGRAVRSAELGRQVGIKEKLGTVRQPRQLLCASLQVTLGVLVVRFQDCAGGRLPKRRTWPVRRSLPCADSAAHSLSFQLEMEAQARSSG